MLCLRKRKRKSHIVAISIRCIAYAYEEVVGWNAERKKKENCKENEKLTKICSVSTVDAKGVCTVFSEWVGVIED